MRKILSIVRFSPNRWFRQMRSGSVLILVVALVVILALLGTAFVATARLDRANAGSPVGAPLISAQLQALQNEICKHIANGLYDQSTGVPIYRPVENNPTIIKALNSTALPVTPQTAPTYGNFDSNRWTSGLASPYGTADPSEWDTWLADRLPVPVQESGTAGDVAWRVVSRLPGRNFTDIQNIGGPTLYYDPWQPTTTSAAPVYMVPTAVALTYPRSANENPANTPKVYPAFLWMQAGVSPPAPVNNKAIIAADADGDGIADSLLFNLNTTSPSPQGTISYFAAVRIVDNNSAVNINTAWSRYSDFQVGGSPGTSNLTTPVDALGNTNGSTSWPISLTPGIKPGAANLGWLPSHVGLLELLDPKSQTGQAFPAPSGGAQQLEMGADVNYWRFGSAAPIAATVYSDPNGTPPLPRMDYQYITLGDALYQQLSRRLAYPGYSGNHDNANPPNYYRYAAVSDNGELAFRFNMIDPNANVSPALSPAYAPSVAEQLLPTSAYADAINYVVNRTYNAWSTYPADKAVYWYDYNFNSDGTGVGTAAGQINSARDNDGNNKPSSIQNLGGQFYRNLRRSR